MKEYNTIRRLGSYVKKGKITFKKIKYNHWKYKTKLYLKKRLDLAKERIRK